MRPETGRVTAITHIADIKQTVRITQVHLSFKMSKVHHAGTKIVAYQNNVGTSFNF
jgi:hypothetical protein